MPLPRSPSQQQQQTVNEQIANIMQSMQANSEGVRRRTARQQSAPVQPSLGLDETLPVDRTQSTPAPSTQAPLEQNPYKNESWLYYLSMLPFRIGYTAVSGTLNVAYHFLRSLIPGGAATETANGANTLQAYLQTTFGRAPTFLPGSYRDAVLAGRRQLKFLLLYIHSPEHPASTAFCNALCAEHVVSFINDNVLFWGESVASRNGAIASRSLHVYDYPFLGLVIFAENRSVLVDKHEGPMRADEILGWVSSKMEQFGSFMELERTAEVERVQSRIIRDEQDQAYEESVKADQEKQRRLKEAEEEAARAKREEEERLKAEEQAATKLQQEREAKRARVPVEPAEDVSNVRIVIQHAGGRLQRRFNPTDTVQVLYDYVDISEVVGPNFTLLFGSPRVALSNMNATLVEAKLAPRSLIFVQDNDA